MCGWPRCDQVLVGTGWEESVGNKVRGKCGLHVGLREGQNKGERDRGGAWNGRGL
jgi:hypothetical protein